MDWGENWRSMTDDEFDELEWRLEAVKLAALHGTAEAVRMVNMLYPGRLVDEDTIRRWEHDYELNHNLTTEE